MSEPTCPACESTYTYIDEDGDFRCVDCGEYIRAATPEEIEAVAEQDAELAADRILEQQELEDFEGREFYEDPGDPYDCEYDRGDEC
jgi:tRNA(Ile2) C34 agmatinyltransferase TiaS